MKVLDEIAKMLLEIDEITRWFLLLFIILFFISGYSMVGKFGLEGVLPRNLAIKIHATLDIPTLLLLLIHCCPRIYFRLKRRFRS